MKNRISFLLLIPIILLGVLVGYLIGKNNSFDTINNFISTPEEVEEIVYEGIVKVKYSSSIDEEKLKEAKKLLKYLPLGEIEFYNSMNNMKYYEVIYSIAYNSPAFKKELEEISCKKVSLGEKDTKKKFTCANSFSGENYTIYEHTFKEVMNNNKTYAIDANYLDNVVRTIFGSEFVKRPVYFDPFINCDISKFYYDSKLNKYVEYAIIGGCGPYGAEFIFTVEEVGIYNNSSYDEANSIIITGSYNSNGMIREVQFGYSFDSELKHYILSYAVIR